MSTKVIVIGKPEKGKTKTAIEFQSFLDTTLQIDFGAYSPSSYKYIELICKDYALGFDLMFAYNDPNGRSCGVLYIGHFNDGIVNDGEVE
jgi:hypothetical protein